jgi:hypothetical protein
MQTMVPGFGNGGRRRTPASGTPLSRATISSSRFL